MISQPVVENIYVYRGRDFKKTYELQDSNGALIDITNWDFDAQIRPVYGSDNLIAEMNISISVPLATVTISLNWEVTKLIDAENPINVGSNTTSTNMVWDLMVTNNADEVYSLLTGKVIFNETSTVKEA